MSYIFCHPKLGKGSIYIEVEPYEYAMQLRMELQQKYAGNGAQIIIYKQIPYKQSPLGDFYAPDEIKPIVKIEEEEELKKILDNFSIKFDLDKYLNDIPQVAPSDILFESEDGFVTEN